MNCQNNQKGFSLIEIVIAIAILGMVVASIIGIETSVVRILQFSTEKQKAALILRSSMAQLDYLVSEDGFKAFPKPGESKIWESKLNPKFTNEIATTKPDIKLSQLLLSALQIYFMGREEEVNPDLVKIMFTAVGDNIDRSITGNATLRVDVKTSWTEGKNIQKIEENIFLINSGAIENFKFFQ